MSDRSDKAKLEMILDYINDIKTIVSKHSSIANTLADIEGQYAILMCIQQIGELVNKIDTEHYKSKIPVRDIVGFRNIIVHNYDGVNLKMVQDIVEKDIPELEEIITAL